MRHLQITQPGPESPPIVDVYYACTFPGCRARYFLPRGQKLRSLVVHARFDGWHIGAAGAERCPDHRPGEPLQLMPATLDPLATVVDVVDPAPVHDPIPSGYPVRPAHVMPRRPNDGTYAPPVPEVSE